MNDERYRHSAAIQPIEFTVDAAGERHFASECQPLRTIINPESVYQMAVGLDIDYKNGIATFTLDGKTVIYDRTGFDLRGNWICDLRIGSKRGIEG